MGSLTVSCTGLAASWCPMHGDCTCRDEHGDADSLDRHDCPLHRPASNHPDGSWTADPLDVLRVAHDGAARHPEQGRSER